MIWKSLLAGIVLAVLAGSVVYLGLGGDISGGELSEDLYETPLSSSGVTPEVTSEAPSDIESKGASTDEVDIDEVEIVETESKVLPSETIREMDGFESNNAAPERTDRLPAKEGDVEIAEDADANEAELDAEEKPAPKTDKRTTREKLGDLIGRELD